MFLSIVAAIVFSFAAFSRAHACSGKVGVPAGSSLHRSTHDRDDAVACTNESLEGVYGLNISGTRPAPPSPTGTQNYIPGTIEQLIGVGTRTFDGDGHFTQITNEKGSLSGILVPNRALDGDYTINADCSG